MKKFLSFLLAVMMLATMMTVPAMATENTYSLTDLLGDLYAIRDTKTNLEATASKAIWASPAEGSALGTAGDAVEINFNITMDLTDDAVSESVTFVIYDADGTRAYMGINEGSAWISAADTGTLNFASADALKMINQDTTLLFVNNPTNYSVYMKENGGYRHLLTTTGKRSSSGTAVNISPKNTTTIAVSSIVYYGGIGGKSYYLRDAISTFTNDTKQYTHSPADGGYILGDAGDFAELKFSTNIDTAATGDSYVDFIMAKSDGARVWLRIHKTGAWVKNGNGVVNLSAEAVAKIRNVDTTLLILNKDSNFVFYVKNNGVYEPIFTSTGWGTNDTSRKNIQINQVGATAGFVDVKCYESTGLAESATVVENTVLLAEQNFATTIGGDIVKEENVAVQNGAMNIPAGENIVLTGTTIPVGGYGEFKFKTANKLTVQMGDGSVGCDIFMHISAVRSGSTYAPATGSWPQFVSYVVGRTDEWHTYRIVRESANVYSLYHKGENDKGWVQVIDSHNMGERQPNLNGFRFIATDGAAQVDDIKVYGPASADGLLVTDSAYKTQEVVEGSTLKTDEVRALVTGKKGTLIFAGYGDGDKLLIVEPKEVDGTVTADEEIFNTDVAGVKTVKVFFWDDFEGMTSLADMRYVIAK